jgi:ClpP class serine protease
VEFEAQDSGSNGREFTLLLIELSSSLCSKTGRAASESRQSYEVHFGTSTIVDCIAELRTDRKTKAVMLRIETTIAKIIFVC